MYNIKRCKTICIFFYINYIKIKNIYMAQYLKNDALRNEIIKCKECDTLSNEAIRMFTLIAENYANKLSFKYEDDKYDCIAYAIMDCFMYWRGYNPEISANAFSYYTSIIQNGFAKGWRKLGHKSLPISKKISLSQNKIYNL